jgi:hypothetical protein
MIILVLITKSNISGLNNPYKKEISIKTNPEIQNGRLMMLLKELKYLSAYQERAIY